MCERVVSVESDLETLGRTGCERKKAGRRGKIGSSLRDCRWRYCTRRFPHKRSCRETHNRTRPSTLT